MAGLWRLHKKYCGTPSGVTPGGVLATNRDAYNRSVVLAP